MRAAVTAVLLVACTAGDIAERSAPLGPLPPPAPVSTERFRDAETCAQCHLAPDDTTVLHDATGTNVSPVMLWRSSLMALAARDPYYLAVFSEEPPGTTLCSRCHGPAGVVEAGHDLGFDELVSGTADAHVLGRGGVTCTLCHQIAASGLGEESSFSGGFQVGYQRQIFGRYTDPRTSPMELIVNYTPVGGAQINQASLCGSCHTVIVDGVVEQATFLEWRSSSFAAQAKPCQLCHVPVVDDAGAAISTPVSVYPASLAPRSPFGRHTFVGGNSWVLSLIADAIDWSGAGISADEVLASAQRDNEHLTTAAELAITDSHREGDTAVVTIKVTNLTGHKLPTGYPNRRVWLHVKATAGGQTVFESGGTDTFASQPHRDVVDGADQVQVWESELVDANGMPTHRATNAQRYGKDNRILPAGFAPTTASDRTRTAPVGTTGDANFIGGSDSVTYRIAGAPANLTLDVELLYEAIRPDLIDAIDRANTPATTKFVDLARSRPVTPVHMAKTTGTIP